MDRTLGVAFTVHAMTHERAAHLHPDSSCAQIVLESDDDDAADQAVTDWCETLRLDCMPSQDESVARQNAVRVAQSLARWRQQGVTDVVVHCEDGTRRAKPIVTAIAAAGFGRSHFWESAHSDSRDDFCEAVSRELAGLLGETGSTLLQHAAVKLH